MNLANRIKTAIWVLLRGERALARPAIHPVVTYTTPSNKLSRKHILITGGGKGLGLAMAHRFVAEGAHVVLTGRDEAALSKAAQDLHCSYLVHDVCDIASSGRIIEKAAAMLGTLDTLVCNAGISCHEGTIRDVTQESFEKQVNINLKGAYFLAQQFISYIKKHNLAKSALLFLSSERGSFCDDLPYGLIKAAINSLVGGLAARGSEHGLTVNALAPGITATGMTGYEQKNDMYCGYNINERCFQPEEVAEIAAFLISDAASLITGQIILCNEGRHLNPHWRKW